MLLWLVGNSMRVTILAVPPLLPSIHHDLSLSETEVGALTALPVLLLAAGATAGSLLVARLGPRRALVLGLLVIAVGGAARGIGPFTPLLFLMTLCMGIGIAVCQPAVPSLVRFWFPGRSGRATAIYANGHLVGEILAAALTVPLVLPLVAHRWEWGLGVWSLPVFLTAGAVLLLSAHEPRPSAAKSVRWWPDWTEGSALRLGFVLGCASIAYFGANAFLPEYLHATHQSNVISAALISLNLCQLPASLLTAAVPQKVVGRRAPLVASGVLTVVSAAGLSIGGVWTVIAAGGLGFACGQVFVLILALPPLLAGAHDVHRMTAAIYTISYTCSFLGSLSGGAIWDASGIPVTTFSPILLAGLVMVALSRGLDLSRAHSAQAETTVPL